MPSPEMKREKGKRLRCPVCKAPVIYEGNPWRPFCSERCKLRDLGAWAEEEYRIPGGPVAGEEEGGEGDGCIQEDS